MATQGLCIVTGATGSIGKEIARALAARGCNIVLACRNTARAEELRRELLAVAGCGDVIVAKVSLDSLDSISDFCNRIIALNRPIAAILHNAGVMCRYRSLTADGFEQSLAVNYLAPVLITHRLLPLVADGGCITFTTSITKAAQALRGDSSRTRGKILAAWHLRPHQARTHALCAVAERASVEPQNSCELCRPRCGGYQYDYDAAMVRPACQCHCPSVHEQSCYRSIVNALSLWQRPHRNDIQAHP